MLIGGENKTNSCFSVLRLYCYSAPMFNFSGSAVRRFEKATVFMASRAFSFSRVVLLVGEISRLRFHTVHVANKSTIWSCGVINRCGECSNFF